MQATSKIPRRMPLPDSALTQNSSAASRGTGTPANIRRATDLPRVKREPCDNPTHPAGNLAPLAKCHEWLAPEVLEARRRQLGVPHRVLDILVPEVIL